MAGDVQDQIPESGAAFTFGKSKFADNIPSKFWLKNDVPCKVACGDEHTALITENGKLFVFGSNNWGQLGLGEKASVKRPTCVKALKSEKVKLVACGRTHTLVYTSQGNLYATGGNNEGQLGLEDFKDRTSFQLVKFFSERGPIKMLAAGSNTSAALTCEGNLYVWGDNSEGQIGLGKVENTSTPREVSAGRRVAWISCGYYHSAFVTENGALFTFGESDGGKLGLSKAQLANHKQPQQVDCISERVLKVACGGGHTVALADDCLYSFGVGQFGQLGHGTFTFESHSPKVVEHFRKGRVKHIACGENHTAVITDCGLLYTFGDGRHGKLALGDENFVNRFKPTLCPRFLRYNVHYVSCGGCHMLVLAKPRLGDSGDVILEDDDATEVYLERPHTDLIPHLNRSLSARDRRREREHSPEQFGMMFRTLPPLSSKTLSSRMAQTEKKTVTNSLQRADHPSTGNVTEVHEIDWKASEVQEYEDNQSVKDLGDTTDLLNLTHVMNIDANEKTLALSPVQKFCIRAAETELSDDETSDDEQQLEDEEKEEKEKESDQEMKQHEQEDCMKKLNETAEKQDTTIIRPVCQENKDTEQATEFVGEVTDSQNKCSTGPLIEDKLQDQNETKEEKPKRLFGSNSSRISLFKWRSSTKDKVETTVDRDTAEKPGSFNDEDLDKGNSMKASGLQPLRSHSATCILL